MAEITLPDTRYSMCRTGQWCSGTPVLFISIASAVGVVAITKDVKGSLSRPYRLCPTRSSMRGYDVILSGCLVVDGVWVVSWAKPGIACHPRGMGNQLPAATHRGAHHRPMQGAPQKRRCCGVAV